MATILFIRHGQASFGAQVYDQLSTLGTRQAAAAGQYLRATGKTIYRILSGTLQRQILTATEISLRVQMPAGVSPSVKIDPRLDEIDIEQLINVIGPRLDDPDGMISRHLQTAHVSRLSRQLLLRRSIEHWQTSEEEIGGESWVGFYDRVASFLHDVTAQAGSGETTVVVTSGGVISAVMLVSWGIANSKCYDLMEIIGNCSITKLIHSGNRCNVSSFNETAYLDAMGIDMVSSI